MELQIPGHGGDKIKYLLFMLWEHNTDPPPIVPAVTCLETSGVFSACFVSLLLSDRETTPQCLDWFYCVTVINVAPVDNTSI